jgi:hypothetical protein
MANLQDVVADIVASATASEDTIGHFTLVSSDNSNGVGPSAASSSSGPLSGRKRNRTQMTLELNPKRVAEIAGSDAVQRTPLRYNMTLEDPLGARVMTHSAAAAAFSIAGQVVHSGTVVADTSDPAYAAFLAHRSKARKTTVAQAGIGTKLADSEDVARMVAARQEAPPLVSAAELESLVSKKTTHVPKVRSVLELFEKGPMWTLKNMIEATGKKESDMRADAHMYCDYVRSGEFARYYILKRQFRNARTPLPDPETEKHLADTPAASSTAHTAHV